MSSAGEQVLAGRPDGLEISLDPGRVDVERVHRWLSEDAYWSLGRTRDVVERSLAGSVVAGVYDGAGPTARQVGLARAVTDDATFAWICDVYIDPEYRSQGIGTWLCQVLVEELVGRRGIAQLLLATRDAHRVYTRNVSKRDEYSDSTASGRFFAPTSTLCCLPLVHSRS